MGNDLRPFKKLTIFRHPLGPNRKARGLASSWWGQFGPRFVVTQGNGQSLTRIFEILKNLRLKGKKCYENSMSKVFSESKNYSSPETCKRELSFVQIFWRTDLRFMRSFISPFG